MLNRLFIVVGVLAILAIAAAFVVPRFVDGEFLRARMQEVASEALGAPVEIVGEIRFSLLPQPQFDFADVKVGDPEAPTLTVAKAEAQLTLLDLLRDRYVITKLILSEPAVAVGVNAAGVIETGISLAEEVTTSNVAVTSAEIVDGRLMVTDSRSNETFAASGIKGELRMDALRGPFTFQGTGAYQGEAYSTRASLSAIDDTGAAQMAVFLAPADERFSLSVDGTLSTGASPAFAGAMTYRQKPPPLAVTAAENEDAGRGDFLMTSKVDATSQKVVLKELTIVPDENRAAARLLGDADATLGKDHAFNVVLSGGVLALPPRDGTADPSTLPYELVQLLNELPLPPQLGIGGYVGVQIIELNLRAVSLRNVVFDANWNGRSWAISDFKAELPGNSTLRLDGTLSVDGGKPTFMGTTKIASARLDALSALWRKPVEGNPLFNASGSLEARISLVGETLSFSGATLTIGEQSYPFEAELGFASATRHLNFRTNLGALDAAASAALLALLPDAGTDPRFGVTFPKGRFDVTAEAATVAGVSGRGFAARGTWDGGVLAIEKLAAEDFGGMGFDAALTVFGSLARPELSGTASISIDAAGAPALARLYGVIGTPPGVRAWLGGSLPAALELKLDAPSGEGSQTLTVTGTAGAADLRVDATLGLGLARAFAGPLTIKADLKSDDTEALTAQLGLGSTSLVPPGAPMHVVAVVDGTAANSFETTVRIDSGPESLAFAGNMIAGNLEAISGNGTLRVALSDLSAITGVMGASGIWLPPINGSARVDFDGLDRVKVSGINGTSGGKPFSGTIEWAKSGATGSLTGEIAAGEFDPMGLLKVLAGEAAAMRSAASYWPDGPADTGQVPRTTTGRISVTAPAIILDGAPIATEASFDLTWDATTARLRDFTATTGGGKATAELAVCCAGPLAQKQVSGRLGLADVDFTSVVPQPIGDAIAGRVNAAARFEGTGDTLLAALSAMTGEGNYTLRDVTVRGFDPSVFNAISSLDEAIELEVDGVTARVRDRLDDGAFGVDAINGSFTVAGGILRSPNLAIEGTNARLFGNTTIRLADLGLSGGFAMTPSAPTGPDGILTDANAQVAASFGGTVPAPSPTFDVSGMVGAIMVRAYEIELQRLEQLRAEDEARQKAAAEERARLAREQAQKRAAEEAAKKKAEDEAAAKKAAEEAAARKAAEEAAAKKAAEEAAAAAANETQEPVQPSQPAPQPLQPGFQF